MKIYLLVVATGAVLPIERDEFDAWPEDKKEGFKPTDVIFIKHKQFGREVPLPRSEWDKFGEREKDEWEVLDTPEEREKSILEEAFAAGSLEREPKSPKRKPKADAPASEGEAS